MDTIETAKTSQDRLEELRHRTEDYVREQPTKAVGFALATGVILTVFPVFRMLTGIFRLFFALLRPALMLFGAVKVYEEISKRYDV